MEAVCFISQALHFTFLSTTDLKADDVLPPSAGSWCRVHSVCDHAHEEW